MGKAQTAEALAFLLAVAVAWPVAQEAASAEPADGSGRGDVLLSTRRA